MLDRRTRDHIRDIFLHPRPHVSITSATALLGWTPQQMKAAIAAGEIELMQTPLGKWVTREELKAKAVEQWPMEAIEEALGAEAESVLPQAVRVAVLRARIPRYQIDMLKFLAERDRTTVSHVLTRELDGVANAHAEELTVAVPTFASASQWP